MKRAFLLFLATAMLLTLCGCGSRYRINIVGGEDLVISCPKSAKSGETVTVKTTTVTDGWLELRVTGAEVTAVQGDLFQFTMPRQNVEVRVVFAWDEWDDGEVDNGDFSEEMTVRITADGHSFTAILYDNEATRALWEQLPMTLPMMNLYEREMCYRMGNGALPDDTAADIGYEIGDISYWPPAGSLVILYKQKGEVIEQVRIGHTDEDISFFDGMADSEITFERAEDDHTEEKKKMKLIIGETEVPVTWEENASINALRDLAPLTIQMSMYGGFEQVGPIGRSIVRDDHQTVTNSGDIVLYSGNQVVAFYGSNSWAYTRLGHVDLSEGEMAELLSNGDVTIQIFVQ